MSGDGKSRMTFVDVAYVVVLAALLCAGVYYLRVQKTGVVDSRKLARQLGVEEVLNNRHAKRTAQASVKVDMIKEEVRRDMDALAAALSKTAGTQETSRVQAQISMKQKDAYEAIEAARQELQYNFARERTIARDALQPYVAKIARKRKIDVVLDSAGGMGIMYAHKRIDITDDVIKEASGKFSIETVLDAALREEKAPSDMDRQENNKPATPPVERSK